MNEHELKKRLVRNLAPDVGKTERELCKMVYREFAKEKGKEQYWPYSWLVSAVVRNWGKSQNHIVAMAIKDLERDGYVRLQDRSYPTQFGRRGMPQKEIVLTDSGEKKKQRDQQQ